MQTSEIAKQCDNLTEVDYPAALERYHQNALLVWAKIDKGKATQIGNSVKEERVWANEFQLSLKRKGKDIALNPKTGLHSIVDRLTPDNDIATKYWFEQPQQGRNTMLIYEGYRTVVFNCINHI